jgi:hypothetical protein
LACSLSCAGGNRLSALANDVVILDGGVIDNETGLDAICNVAIEGDEIVANWA